MNASTASKKRRIWLAALLSLLLPGLGQLYNRNAPLALPLMAVSILVPVPGLWLVATLPATATVPAAAVLLAIIIALTTFAIIHAAIVARRVGSMSLAWFNRWFIYLGLYCVAALWQNTAPFLRISSIESYNMPSGSMIPTLLVGDYMSARTRAFEDRLPERGELAVFRPPSEPDVDFVKRIIGLPGDRIQLREGRLYLNGAVIDRVPLNAAEAAPLVREYPNSSVYREILPDGASYLIAEISDDEGLDNTPEFIVPAGYVFVLGDNRDRSNDSRGGLGFIPNSGLRDKPLFLYWSSDLGRIGKVIE